MNSKRSAPSRTLIEYLLPALLLCLIALAASKSQAQQVEPGVTLDYFGNNPLNGTDGNGLLQLPDGNFYGTTRFNGASGRGTIFKITPGGNFTKLHDFSTAEGSVPMGYLTQGQDGNLYGTTAAGGAFNGGTVFVLTPNPATGIFDGNSVLKTLHPFNTNSTDGYNPQAGLVQDTNGVLFGTTQYGGSSQGFGAGSGTVFSFNPGGSNYQIIHAFSGTDGAHPCSNLTWVQLDGARYLYGVTLNGGHANLGAVFSIWPGTHYVRNVIGLNVPVTNVFTQMYSFSGTDGANPFDVNGLIQDSHDLIPGAINLEANLYGTTLNGGQIGDGTVFKLTLTHQFTSYGVPIADSALTTLHSFSALGYNSYNQDGAYPCAGLIQSVDGVLYGATQVGGEGQLYSLANGGTLYQITPDRSSGIYDGGSGFRTLHNFTSTDGSNAGVPPTQGADGNLYGTTGAGGLNNGGALYRVGPAITSVTPNSVPNSSNAPLTVYGSGFAANDVIMISGQTFPTHYVSSTELTTTLPASGIAGSGSVPVTVYDPNINNASVPYNIRINFPQLNIVEYGDYRDRSNNVGVTLQITNTGGGWAQNVVINASQVGAYAAIGVASYAGSGPNPTNFSSLPFTIGDLAPGQSTYIVLLYPSALKGGGAGYLGSLSGTYSGGSFTEAFRVFPP